MSDEPDDGRWREYRVAPRYLAGSSGIGDPGFEPVAHWPHHSLDDGPCQLMVTSPDHRIRIGRYGDDFDVFKVTASEDAVGPVKWSAYFNHNFPPEIVAGFTEALAHDWAEDQDRFLARPSMRWTDNVQPMLDADWVQDVPAVRGTVPVVAPDQLAGALLDSRSWASDAEVVRLWAGPPGWATRAEATFTAQTPSHLIAATAAAMTDPAPVVRERHMIHRDVERFVRLEPVDTQARSASRASTPTPLDAKRAAVTAAMHRAEHGQPDAARAQAARIRTEIGRAHV